MAARRFMHDAVTAAFATLTVGGQQVEENNEQQVNNGGQNEENNNAAQRKVMVIPRKARPASEQAGEPEWARTSTVKWLGLPVPAPRHESSLRAPTSSQLAPMQPYAPAQSQAHHVQLYAPVQAYDPMQSNALMQSQGHRVEITEAIRISLIVMQPKKRRQVLTQMGYTSADTFLWYEPRIPPAEIGMTVEERKEYRERRAEARAIRRANKRLKRAGKLPIEKKPKEKKPKEKKPKEKKPKERRIKIKLSSSSKLARKKALIPFLPYHLPTAEDYAYTLSWDFERPTTKIDEGPAPHFLTGRPPTKEELRNVSPPLPVRPIRSFHRRLRGPPPSELGSVLDYGATELGNRYTVRSRAYAARKAAERVPEESAVPVPVPIPSADAPVENNIEIIDLCSDSEDGGEDLGPVELGKRKRGAEDDEEEEVLEVIVIDSDSEDSSSSGSDMDVNDADDDVNDDDADADVIVLD